MDEAALNEAVDRAVRDDGKYVSPFLLVAGEVRFPFDEMATLKATLSIVTPFATGDEPLKMTIADAREFLRTPDLLSPPGVVEGFTSRVQDAFRKMRRAVPPGYLEDQTERVLVEKRLYQRRDVFGGIHLRAQLYLAPNSKPWPLYVPEAIATKLPMFSRFSARILADALLQEDQYETHPSSLRAWAIGRVAAAPTRPIAPPKHLRDRPLAAPRGATRATSRSNEPVAAHRLEHEQHPSSVLLQGCHQLRELLHGDDAAVAPVPPAAVDVEAVAPEHLLGLRLVVGIEAGREAEVRVLARREHLVAPDGDRPAVDVRLALLRLQALGVGVVGVAVPPCTLLPPPPPLSAVMLIMCPLAVPVRTPSEDIIGEIGGHGLLRIERVSDQAIGQKKV